MLVAKIAPEADEPSCWRYYHHNPDRFIDNTTKELLPFSFVQQHIHDYLQTQSLQTGISHYIKVLAGKRKIVGFSLDGSDGPLVQ